MILSLYVGGTKFVYILSIVSHWSLYISYWEVTNVHEKFCEVNLLTEGRLEVNLFT